MREAEIATAAAPVSDTDYVQLSRLVTEAAWRVDIGVQSGDIGNTSVRRHG